MGFCELAPFPQRARKGWGTRLDLIRTHKKPPSGAKARADYAGFMRGLKPPPPSGSSFSAGFSAGPIQSLLGDASFDAPRRLPPWAGPASRQLHASRVRSAARRVSRADAD